MSKKMAAVFMLTASVLLFIPFFVAFASGTKPPDPSIKKAPGFPRGGTWINAGALDKNIFRDKLTMVYFWDYNSINCIREMGHLKSWHERYQPRGFQIIMVHAPEFEFAKKKEHVEKAVRRLQLSFPVFLDNEFKLWDEYKTRSWPTKYLINAEGHVVLSQGGEEGYLRTENEIRDRLRKKHPGAKLPDPVVTAEENKFSLENCGPMSPETYMGYERAEWWGGGIATKKGVLPDETIEFRDRGKRLDRGFFVHGLWTNRKDSFEHARETEEFSDYLGMIYIAEEVYSVISRHDEGRSDSADERVYVTRDELPVPPENRGRDLQEDLNGRTYLYIQEPRLYYLITGDDDKPHELKLWVRNEGISINSFSFSNRCLSDFEHL